MNFERKSGILLHITSLPGRWGMGELGPQARAFGEFLAETGQKLWQILPTGPIGFGYSPYSSLSAFAGNHLLISFDELIEDGLLTERQLAGFPQFDPQKIDFPAVIASREKFLFRAADRFEPDAAFMDFCTNETDWLDDYALFMAIRETQEFRPWIEWPAELRDREAEKLDKTRRKLAKRIRRHKVLQYLFSRHWKKTAEFIEQLGVTMVGDIPIFVAGDSADVWANRELFCLNDDGKPSIVAGVPPDYFSETGQRWGNPLYDWDAHWETGYAWWTQRMYHILQMTGIVRIDHFRGFEAYWAIPETEPTAVKGCWLKGPGLEFFQTLEKNLRPLCAAKGKRFLLDEHVIAENLGLITEDVESLREACGFPGMWVLQFRFSEDELARAGYYPEGVEKNWVVYPGTHDNDTTEGWFQSLDEKACRCVGEYLQIDGRPGYRDLVELALRAPAKWAIVPMQDVLGLDTAARMNTPGVTEGNWGWRFDWNLLSPEIKHWLNEATVDAGRSKK